MKARVFIINCHNILPSFIHSGILRVGMLRALIWAKDRWLTHLRILQYLCHRANMISLYSIRELQIRSEGIIIVLLYMYPTIYSIYYIYIIYIESYNVCISCYLWTSFFGLKQIRKSNTYKVNVWHPSTA